MAYGREFITVHTTIDAISVAVHTVTNLFGIGFNLLLMLLIVVKTPPTLRVYSLLLLNSAIIDLVGCLSAVFVMQRYDFL